MVLDDIGKKVGGVWLPKDEQHLTEWMVKSKGRFEKDGVLTYQWAKQSFAQDAMIKYIPDYGTRSFIDVGAHVGLWSMWWSCLMAGTIAFEPIPEMRELYRANMQGRGRYLLLSEALGHQPGCLELSFNKENTGNTHATRQKNKGLPIIQVAMTTLDLKMSVMPNSPAPGVIKIDCEGFEELVVRGAEATIREHRPLLIVEQKKGSDYYGMSPLGAVEVLTKWGFKVVKTMSGDHIMVHEVYL